MVNGVSVNENLRGQPYNLYIEDAIQETNVATAGISAEYGRFGGGVVNVVTKSGGNLFSGSFRDTLNNDNWRTLTPFEDKSIAADPQHKDTRVAKTVPAYEYTFGGPITEGSSVVLHRRAPADPGERTAAGDHATFRTHSPTSRARYEAKGTYSINSNHTFQGAYTKITKDAATHVQHQRVDGPEQPVQRPEPAGSEHGNYNGMLTPTFFVEARVSRAPLQLRERRRAVDRPDQRHAAARSGARPDALLVARPSAASAIRRSATTTTCSSKGTYFLSTRGHRIAQHGVRLRHVQRQAVREQPPVRQRLPHHRHDVDHRADSERHAGVPA